MGATDMQNYLDVGEVPLPDQVAPPMMDLPAPDAKGPVAEIPQSIPELKVSPLYEARDISGALYLKLDDINAAVHGCTQVAGLLQNSEAVLSRLNDLKIREDKAVLEFKSLVEACQRKLVYIEKNILR